MKKLLLDYEQGKLGAIRHILIVLAAVSGLFTFNGASMDARDFNEMALASALALGGSSAIYMFWHFVTGVVPKLETLWEKTVGLTVTLMGCVVIFYLSSGFNVAGLAGRQALELDQARYITTLEVSLDAAYRDSLLIRGLASDVRMEIARYEQAAKDEFERGTYSGEPGIGAVHNTLTKIGQRLSTLGEEVDVAVESADALSESGKARLETVRTIKSANDSMALRKRSIAREADALRLDLAKMDVRGFAQTVKRTLDALPGEVDLQTNFSKNPETAKRQIAALNKVREDIERTGFVIGGFIDGAAARPPAQIEAFEEISAHRAVMVYWSDYKAFWAAGIALDIAPMAAVIFYMIGFSRVTREELARTAMQKMTIEDVSRGQMGLEFLRRTGLDPDTLKRLNNSILGKDDDDGES